MKSIKMSKSNLRIALLLFISAAFFACNRDRNNPGWDYFPDMFYSTAYETNTKNPNFKDGMTMRTPPEGSVPRGYEPFRYTIDPESRVKAGKELINPYSSGNEAVLRGKYVYTTFCLGCHGDKGEGDGRLYTSGLYPLKPRSLSSAEATVLLDGEIYHSITLGFGAMGSHASQILPEDRWKAILYIRKLQKEVNNGSDQTGK